MPKLNDILKYHYITKQSYSTSPNGYKEVTCNCEWVTPKESTGTGDECNNAYREHLVSMLLEHIPFMGLIDITNNQPMNALSISVCKICSAVVQSHIDHARWHLDSRQILQRTGM